MPQRHVFKDKNMGEESVMSGVTIGKFMCVVFCRMFPEVLHCHISQASISSGRQHRSLSLSSLYLNHSEFFMAITSLIVT